jgi:subtilisin
VLGSSNAPANDAGSGIRVAIVDTGVDYNHADLKRPDGTSIVVGSHNSVDETKPCLDDNGHGTHVAGTVAAQNNSQDVVGVAPGVSLLCVKVLNAQGSGAWSTIIDGLDWVWNNDAPLAHVVNMSLGGGGTNEDSDLRQAIGRLHAAGVIVVVAAGNDPALDVSQQAPAAYTELVLTVASTTAADGSSACGITVTKDTASSFTSDGVGVTISAPGQDKDNITQRGAFCYLNPVGILSLKRGGGTTRMSGTSMATPHVSGIVARLVKADPANYTFAGLKGYFDSSTGAEFFGSAPYDSLAKSYTFDGDREGIAILK